MTDAKACTKKGGVPIKNKCHFLLIAEVPFGEYNSYSAALNSFANDVFSSKIMTIPADKKEITEFILRRGWRLE